MFDSHSYLCPRLNDQQSTDTSGPTNAGSPTDIVSYADDYKICNKSAMSGGALVAGGYVPLLSVRRDTSKRRRTVSVCAANDALTGEVVKETVVVLSEHYSSRRPTTNFFVCVIPAQFEPEVGKIALNKCPNNIT